MSTRGTLDKNDLEVISNKLPKTEELIGTIFSLKPDLISIKFEPRSTIPLASVCFHDTFYALQEVTFALQEALAHKIWYQNRNEKLAIFYCRFFTDDAALRLYSAAEHLSEAIIYTLQISTEDLSDFARKRTSRQAILGHFLSRKMSSHPIAHSVLSLSSSSEWKKTILYRDEWVHSQPPILAGLGNRYKRIKRWTYSEKDKVYTLGIGVGDEPEYNIDELLEVILSASNTFTKVLKEIVSFYVDFLSENGISLKPSGGINVNLE